MPCPVQVIEYPAVYPFTDMTVAEVIDTEGNEAIKTGEGVFLSPGTNTIYLFPGCDWVEAQLLYEDRDHLAWN